MGGSFPVQTAKKSLLVVRLAGFFYVWAFRVLWLFSFSNYLFRKQVCYKSILFGNFS